MELNFNHETSLQLLISFGIGAVIGIEREYRSKAAGLRTMIVICLGSTLFTEVSMAIGGSTPDRIAANIVTGVGFLGAGVIFKDGLSISGITTATTIWICAALGMAVGAGEYFIALVGSGVLLMVLVLFERLQKIIYRLHQARVYRITSNIKTDFEPRLESELRKLKLHFRKDREMKHEQFLILMYDVYGSDTQLQQLNTYLRNEPEVKTYEY